MPYDRIRDLPKPIREQLPLHGQRIYRSAFNNAFKQYRERPNRDELAHKVAWAAVKKIYKKDRNGRWVVKSENKHLK